jgi:hypothetical protein
MNAALKLGVVLALALVATPAFAEQTVPEKAKVAKNATVRVVKKAAHRTEEAVCLASDAVCLARKAKHRVNEAGDATVDKVDEVKDKVDNK